MNSWLFRLGAAILSLCWLGLVSGCTRQRLFQQPLQPGDLVCVPPRPPKEYDKFATRIVPLAGIIGSVVLLYSVLKSDATP